MSRYNIETAKSAGFCFGVKRAVEIAEKTGYNSVYSFRRAFKRMMHKSPSDYRGK